MRNALRSAVVTFAVVIGLSGGGNVPETEAAPGKGIVAVVPVRGAAVEGELVSIGEAGLRLAAAPTPHALDGLREVRFSPDGPLAALPPAGVGLRVVLAGGEVVRGTFVSGSEEGFEVKPPDLPAMSLSFDSVRRIEAERAHKGPCDEPARERPPRKGTDVAYAKSGDVFPGTILSANSEGLVLEASKGRTTRVSWADLVVAHLDNPALPPVEGRSAEVETVGGSRLAATAVEGDAKTLSVTLRSGGKVEVPAVSVRAIRWTGGSFVYASDLPFTSKYTPYYSGEEKDKDREKHAEAWYGARADRTALGCPLRIAGTTYRRGIAVHARSAVTLPLAKGFSRFECRFGVDDEALGGEGSKGDVTARVLADGKEVWSSGGSVRGGEPARVVGPIDVTGVETLVLEVDFGGEMFVMDRADWADPVLLRAN
jgi:hypothetical protein